MNKTRLELGLRKVERLRWRTAAAKADLHRTIGRAAIAADLAKQRKMEDRRVRTKRLIALGGIVRVVGLLDLDRDVLLGALASAAQYCTDEKWLERWRTAGAKILRDAGGAAQVDPPETPNPITAADEQSGRKRRTRQLIVAGGIVEKADLGTTSSAVLAAILKAIADSRDDGKRLERWRAVGEAVRTKRIAPVEIEFTAPVDAVISGSLREFGLRFNRKTAYWMGLADPTIAYQLAKSAGGVIRVEPTTGRKPRKPGRKKNLRGSRARPKRERKDTK